jgi:hypothetical protein
MEMPALLTSVLDKEGVAWLVGFQPGAGFLKKLLYAGSCPDWYF